MYSELQVNSSEEERASNSGREVALAADLGWDPTAYYPDPLEVPHETKVSKLISLTGELSSPLLMFQNDDCKLIVMQEQNTLQIILCIIYTAQQLPSKHKKKKHHHSHTKQQPLY